MHKALLLAILMSSTILAGCADDEEGTDEGKADALGWRVANEEPFFANVAYDASKLDLDRLSKPIYEILGVEETLVEMSDGMWMHNAVFRPETTDPVPVFINFSPYWGNTAELKGDNFGKYMIDNFVPRGYAVVLSAIRGTGHSEGCFEVASDRESLDLREVVDYFADQPWSNGNVAAGGKSYDSTTQNGMIAKYPTPNLKAIFHVSGITDMYAYTFHNGLWARADAGLFSTTYSVGQGANEGLGGGENGYDQEKIIRTTQDMTCMENAETVAIPVSTYATGAKTDYWIERDWTRTIGASEWDGSIFFYHGFQDWNVQPSHIQPWLDNLPEQIRVKLWLHQDTENSGHLYPMRTDWNLTMLRWLDSELKGIDTGFWDEPRADLQGTDKQWRAADDWPAPLVEGLTTDDVQANTGPGANGHIARFDVSEFGNASGDVRISGQFKLHLSATTAIPDPQLTAVMTVEGQWVGEASLRGIFRNSLDMPSPVTPGMPVSYVLESYPLDVLIPAGSVLEITTGASARHTITNPAQLGPVIYDAASYVLDLPLTDATTRTDQPKPMPCIAC